MDGGLSAAKMNSTKVQNPRRNSYAGTGRHLHHATAYTTALSVTHARISYRTRQINSVVYGRNAENEPVSRKKWPTTVRS